MKKYESVIIIKPNLKSEELKSLTKKIAKKINDLAKITNIEDIGLKKLAYEVQKCKEGYYMTYEFTVENDESNAIAEIERFYRITDEVLKFIIVRMD